MAFVDPTDPTGVPQSVPVPVHTDAMDPAARNFALARIQQLVNAHLLGGMPQNMTDPTQVWRGLSQGLGQNRTALMAFLAAGQRHAAAPASAPPLVSEHGAGVYAPAQAPQLVSEHGYSPVARQGNVSPPPSFPGHGGYSPMPNYPAHPNVAAILSTLMHSGVRTPF